MWLWPSPDSQGTAEKAQAQSYGWDHNLKNNHWTPSLELHLCVPEKIKGQDQNINSFTQVPFFRINISDPQKIKKKKKRREGEEGGDEARTKVLYQQLEQCTLTIGRWKQAGHIRWLVYILSFKISNSYLKCYSFWYECNLLKRLTPWSSLCIKKLNTSFKSLPYKNRRTTSPRRKTLIFKVYRHFTEPLA